MLCRVSGFEYVFFFKQKTAYEMRISDWSSDVCSSDLPSVDQLRDQGGQLAGVERRQPRPARAGLAPRPTQARADPVRPEADQGCGPLADLPCTTATALDAAGAFGTGGRDGQQSRQARHGSEHSREGKRVVPAAGEVGLSGARRTPASRAWHAAR